MEIIEKNFSFEGVRKVDLARKKYIILHHDYWVGASPELIHNSHRNKGFGGAGYNYWIHKDGLVYALRPLELQGAHCPARNVEGIGICLNGNFMLSPPLEAQLFSLVELMHYLMARFSIKEGNIELHKQHSATSCPGDLFPLDRLMEMLHYRRHWAYDSMSQLLRRGIITEPKDLASYPTYGELCQIIRRVIDLD